MNNQDFSNNSYQPPESERFYSPTSPACIDFKQAFGSKLFLALCIIMTAFVLLIGFRIIPLLLTIGMWICYASGRRADVTMKPGGIKLISGSLLAQFIINWLGIAIIFATSILFFVIGISACIMMTDPGQILSLIYPLAEAFDLIYEVEEIFEEMLYVPKETFISIAAIYIICGVVLVFTGIFQIVLNFLYFKKLHSFTRSLAVCAENPYAVPKNAKWCSVFMIIGAIYMGICALNMLANICIILIVCIVASIAGMSTGATAVASILGTLIYFVIYCIIYGAYALMFLMMSAMHVISFSIINKNFVKPFKNK